MLATRTSSAVPMRLPQTQRSVLPGRLTPRRAVVAHLAAKDLLERRATPTSSGQQVSDEASQLPSLKTPPDVLLTMNDGGCLPAHSSVLELASPLLADGLHEDRAQREPGQQLVLCIPIVTTAQVLELLKVAYSPKPISLVKALKPEPLMGLAEIAFLLQCGHVTGLAEVALIKHSSLLSKDNAFDTYLWAHKHGLLQFKEYSARYITAIRGNIDHKVHPEQPLMLLLQMYCTGSSGFDSFANSTQWPM